MHHLSFNSVYHLFFCKSTSPSRHFPLSDHFLIHRHHHVSSGNLHRPFFTEQLAFTKFHAVPPRQRADSPVQSAFTESRRPSTAPPAAVFLQSGDEW